ncbi:MAG: hypothetical protein QOH31_3534 [Verrucomicrobiota bacterium]
MDPIAFADSVHLHSLCCRRDDRQRFPIHVNLWSFSLPATEEDGDCIFRRAKEAALLQFLSRANQGNNGTGRYRRYRR